MIKKNTNVLETYELPRKLLIRFYKLSLKANFEKSSIPCCEPIS